MLADDLRAALAHYHVAWEAFRCEDKRIAVMDVCLQDLQVRVLVLYPNTESSALLAAKVLRETCEQDFVERVTKQLDELKTRDAGA